MAVSAVETHQIAVGAGDIGPPLANRGSAARPEIVLILPASLIFVDQEHVAVGQVESFDELFLVAIAHGEDLAANDRDAGEAAAQARSLPSQRRAFLAPLMVEAGLVGDPVAMQASPLGPFRSIQFGRLAGRTRQEQNEREQQSQGTLHRGISFEWARRARGGKTGSSRCILIECSA